MIFFFKQKTAYEMRISDWSSDVCSSDLWIKSITGIPANSVGTTLPADNSTWEASGFIQVQMASGNPDLYLPMRSEEHTSELQSLMRISYAVFCLKKKKTKIAQLYKSYTSVIG